MGVTILKGHLSFEDDMATNLHKRFATDDKAERDGAWVMMQEGVEFKVISDNTARIRELRHRLVWQKYRAHYSRMDVPPHIEDAVNIALATALIVDWRGVTDDAGVIIPFSAAAAEAMMTELREVRTNVLFLGGAAETFRKQSVEEMAKNSDTP
jgi:hypothetical protein